MPSRLGNQSWTWAMPWQCSRNIKTIEDYNPPSWLPTSNHSSLSSLISPKPSSKPITKSNTQNLTFQSMLWNTHAFAALYPAPITIITRSMITTFSTWLDCLSSFAHHLLYATILKNTTAYQALHVFSTNNTLTQLAVLFWIYSTLHILFTRATWCLADASNPFQTTAAWKSPTILALK